MTGLSNLIFPLHRSEFICVLSERAIIGAHVHVGFGPFSIGATSFVDPALGSLAFRAGLWR
jgi:hypothetical protein